MDPRWEQSGGAFRRKQQLNWVLKDAWEMARQTDRRWGSPAEVKFSGTFPPFCVLTTQCGAVDSGWVLQAEDGICKGCCV